MSGDDFTPPRSSSFETSRDTASADMCHTQYATICAPPPPTALELEIAQKICHLTNELIHSASSSLAHCLTATDV